MSNTLLACDYTVRDIPVSLCQELVSSHHYAGGGSNTAVYCHGLFKKSDPFTCLGVAWWLPPTKGAATASWDGDWQQVLALSRLVLVPGAPKNAASFLIGKSVKLIRLDQRFFCLITYADEWQGHTGNIYRASNWEYLGLTEPTPCWINNEGRLIAKKAGPRTRTNDEMRCLGYKLLGYYRKHKFRLILHPYQNKVGSCSVQLNLFADYT